MTIACAGDISSDDMQDPADTASEAAEGSDDLSGLELSDYRRSSSRLNPLFSAWKRDAGSTSGTTTVKDAGVAVTTSPVVQDAGVPTTTSPVVKDASVPTTTSTTVKDAGASTSNDAGALKSSTGSTTTSDAGVQPTSTTATPVASTPKPTGGPGGYSTIVMNDLFGAKRSGANITALSQFNPKTAYGASATGWDTWMRYWSPANTYANLAMQDDHLEILPTKGPPGFIVSHLEVLPTSTKSFYIEVTAATGRGAYDNGASTWPAIWLYAGNETNSNDQQSEIDIMEQYTDQQWTSPVDALGLYTQYFTTTIHSLPNHATVGGPYPVVVKGTDVTTTKNVYGCELTFANGQVMWKIYFNGQLVLTAPKGVSWTSSAPAIIIGWNPGTSALSNAVFKLDAVRVWSK